MKVEQLIYLKTLLDDWGDWMTQEEFESRIVDEKEIYNSTYESLEKELRERQSSIIEESFRELLYRWELEESWDGWGESVDYRRLGEIVEEVFKRVY